MPNTNVNLPYGITKQIRIAGKNSANTSERPITGITFVKNATTTIVVSPQDPLIFNVTNTSATISQTSTITWTAQNELGASVSGVTPTTLIPADPAVTIESTEVV